MRSAGTDRREAWRTAGSAQRNVPICISIFRDNIQTYVARPDTNNMFDTAIVHPTARRFIFPANDSSLAVFGLDSNGVWVKGADPTKDEQQWSIGITPVRMPFNGGNVQAGHGFSLAEEGSASGDPTGTLVGGVENSIFKMYSLVLNPDSTEDTLYNVPDPEIMLHHQRRLIEVDSTYFPSDVSVNFQIVGKDSAENKIFVENSTNYSAVIKDTSQATEEINYRISHDGRLTFVGEERMLVSKLFTEGAENTNLKLNVLYGHPTEIPIVDVEGLMLNNIEQMDEMGTVRISMSDKVTIYFDDLQEVEWGLFDAGNGTKYLQATWREYKNMLDGVTTLYLVSESTEKEEISIHLVWPTSIMRKYARTPLNNEITEKITIDTRFDEIVLEPICNDIVPGTQGEVYNPSCVVMGEDAWFKIEVSGSGISTEDIVWRSENGNALFVDDGNSLSNEGVGLTVRVRGVAVGEDKLLVNIDGYDGRKPEISFDVMNWKNVNVHTCIVKNNVNDSAFTLAEIDEAFYVGNQTLKQIGVRLNRVDLIPDNGNPNSDDFYILNSVSDMKDLIDCKKNTTDGIEAYFVKGQTFDEEMTGEAYYNEGCVITKDGYIKEPDLQESSESNTSEHEALTKNLLIHEVLHCMRNEESDYQRVYDIYTERKDMIGNLYQISPKRNVTHTDVPLDWGSGYYRKDQKLGDTIKKLLMYGLSSDSKVDIPRGKILGIDGGTMETKINCGSITLLKNRVYQNED